MNTAAVHYFSQFVYLNLPPGTSPDSAPTVGDIAYYYTKTEQGRAILNRRFQGIAKELALWQTMLEETPHGLAGWQVADILNDNAPSRSGFYGCAFLSPSGERVVAFRGSEMLGNPRYRNDWETDFALIYCEKTAQHRLVDDYWSRYGGRKGTFWLTGHSLGANLAIYGAFSAPGPVRERLAGCLAFNGPGFCPEFTQRYKPALAELGDRLVLYQNKDDIVSSLLENPVQPLIAATAFDPAQLEHPTVSDYLYPHSNFMYRWDEAGEILPEPTGKKSAFCEAVHTLSEMLLLLPLKNREELVTMALDLLYGTADPAAGKKDTVTAIASYLARNLAGHAGVWELTKAAYAAAMLLGKVETETAPQLPEQEKPEMSGIAGALLFLLDVPRRT